MISDHLDVGCAVRIMCLAPCVFAANGTALLLSALRLPLAERGTRKNIQVIVTLTTVRRLLVTNIRRLPLLVISGGFARFANAF